VMGGRVAWGAGRNSPRSTLEMDRHGGLLTWGDDVDLVGGNDSLTGDVMLMAALIVVVVVVLLSAWIGGRLHRLQLGTSFW
jgi:hypothetical protein